MMSSKGQTAAWGSRFAARHGVQNPFRTLEYIYSLQVAVEAPNDSPACTELNMRRVAFLPFPFTSPPEDF